MSGLGSKKKLIAACLKGELDVAVTEMGKFNGSNPLNRSEARVVARRVFELAEHCELPKDEEKLAHYFGIVKLMDPSYLEVRANVDYVLKHSVNVIRAFEPDALSEALKEHIEDKKRQSPEMARGLKESFEEQRNALKDQLTDEVKKELLYLANKEIEAAGSVEDLTKIESKYRPLLALHRDAIHGERTTSEEKLLQFIGNKTHLLASPSRTSSPTGVAVCFLNQIPQEEVRVKNQGFHIIGLGKN